MTYKNTRATKPTQLSKIGLLGAHRMSMASLRGICTERSFVLPEVWEPTEEHTMSPPPLTLSMRCDSGSKHCKLSTLMPS